MGETVSNGTGATVSAIRYSVVALFEDTLDAERVLVALRKADFAPEYISLLVCAATDGDSDQATVVARSLVDSSLETVGGWLRGLVALIVPERGAFLVAGPIGAALAGIRGDDDEPPSDTGRTLPRHSGSGLQHTLGDFGFGEDEAAYLEHRVVAGSALVGITTTGTDGILAVRRIFADDNAVHIGVAQAEASFIAEAEAMLAASPEESSGGDVLITDAVARWIRLGDADDPLGRANVSGTPVVDRDGVEAGGVDDLLAEPAKRDESQPTVRYVVIGFGGLFGIGRHHVPVPLELVDLDATPIRLNMDKATLDGAPSYGADEPFSRREERQTCAYFGVTPYWSTEINSAKPRVVDDVASS